MDTPVALIANDPAPLPSCDHKFSLFALLTNSTWKNALRTEFSKDYMKKIEAFLEREYNKVCFMFDKYVVNNLGC